MLIWVGVKARLSSTTTQIHFTFACYIIRLLLVSCSSDLPRRSEYERTRNPASHSARPSARCRRAGRAANPLTYGRIALGGNERDAEDHTAGTRRPRPQRGGDLVARRARETLATDRLHRLRGCWASSLGHRRDRSRLVGREAGSRGARRGMGGRQLCCRRTQPSTEVPGG